MEDVKVFKIFKIWFISLASFDVLLILFIYTLGNFTDQDIPMNLGNYTAVIAIISGVAGIVSIIHAFTKKENKQGFYGLGIMFFAAILLLFSVILAIATIY